MNLSEKIKENFASFLAAFTPQPTENSALSTQHLAQCTEHSEDSILNTLFAAVSTSYPESLSGIEGFTQLQKAEALTAFFESFSAKMEEISASYSTLQSDYYSLVVSSELIASQLTAANETISDLTAQLSARPSIPLNVSDPQIGIHSTNNPKDETGKQILAALPKDLKNKLK
jgi:hypothetical protein